MGAESEVTAAVTARSPQAEEELRGSGGHEEIRVREGKEARPAGLHGCPKLRSECERKERPREKRRFRTPFSSLSAFLMTSASSEFLFCLISSSQPLRQLPSSTSPP